VLLQRIGQPTLKEGIADELVLDTIASAKEF